MFDKKLLPELTRRWERITDKVKESGADGMLISTNANLFYVAGVIFNGFAYFQACGEPLFFVRRPVGLEGVVYIRKVEDIPAYLAENGLPVPHKLLLENDSITYSEYERYRSVFGDTEILNGTPLIRGLRAVKTPFEIEQIRISAERHAVVYKKIKSFYRLGMTDNDISIAVEHAALLEGSLGIIRIFGQSMEIFMGSVIAGDNAGAPSPYDFAMGGTGNSRVLPIGGNGTVLTPGMSLMVDVGANYTGYMADITRVFSVGRLTDLAYRAHETSIAIDRAVGGYAAPGVAAKDIYDLSAAMAADAGLTDYFMGYRQKAGFVGHGVGIELNEGPVLAPKSREILEEGNAFALEPKFVIPGVGAVGIENTFAVTAAGVEKLTLCEEAIIDFTE